MQNGDMSYTDYLESKQQRGAVIAGRKGIGVELKPSYYRQAVKNM